MIDAPALRPGDTLPPGRAARVAERVRRRMWLLGCCLLIELLPFVTAPGEIISDTKLDLAVAPARFLARALSLWDPQQFGQLQDQAVGYLFPMGPFFALGRLAVLPPWVVQRLWIGAVAVAAFLGAVRLAGRLGIGTTRTRLLAGFAYALSPAGLTLLGTVSSQYLPAAMLPWILLPLVDASGPARDQRANRPVWAAARSAVAVALCGGINAAATIAVLVPAVLYLLTLPRAAPRWRLLAFWVPAVALVSSWWAIPLVLLSKFGVSIVPYTESAAVTTSVTSLSDILRGTENWVSYLVVNGQPWWQLGYRIATGVLPIVATGLIAGLGLAGLIRRGLPARRFLLCSVLAGVLIISAGYVSSLGNPISGPIDHVINGGASAFRNVIKFDPMIRLPVALGLAHLLASARAPRLRTWLTAVAVLAVGGLALPGYLFGLASAGSFGQIPSYWVSAADWLNAHAGNQAVLVVPGAPFSQYVWGSPLDDVLEPLTDVDWAERDLSLIGSPGNERLLDAIDQQLAAGDGSPGLTQVLARMGVKYLVVRNDLSPQVLDGAWPARVSQAVAGSPGLVKVAQFGQPVGGQAPDDAVSDFGPPYPPVQIYQVAGATPVASVQPAAGTVRVYGGPEALITLANEGLLGHEPVLLNSDSPGLPTAASVVTDSLRRRVRNFGELRTSFSPTLTAGQPAQTFEATGDYTEPGWNAYDAVAQYHGISAVTASSSAAGIETIPAQWASGLLPYSAVDGDTQTMWESGGWTGPIGQWIQIGFDSRVNPGLIQVTFADDPALGPPVTRVTVSTAAGRVSDRVRLTGSAQPVRVPRGATGWLRITVTGLASRPHPAIGAQVGIREIAVPGVQASRTIAAPDVPALGDRGPAAVALAKAQPQPSGCMRTSQRWVCSPALMTPTEEQYGFDQGFTAAADGRAGLRGSAVLIDPWLVTGYADQDRRHVRVSASSTYTPDPQDQPSAAFDGDPATTWVASPGDDHPTLSIGWNRPHTVSQVIIKRPPGAAGLLQVLFTGSGGQVRGGLVGPSGIVRFKPMRTTGLTMEFTPLQTPLQISEVQIPRVPELGTPSGSFRLPCGRGPQITVNGRAVPTEVSGTYADLLNNRPVQFAACSPVPVAAGANRVTEPAADAFDVQNVVLESTGPAARALAAAAQSRPVVPAKVLTWTSSMRVLSVAAPTRSYLVVNENFNAGWRAQIDGRQLTAVRLDGWKQAWVLPAGTSGVVTLTYPPDGPYLDAVIGGLAAMLYVMLVALWPLAARRWLWSAAPAAVDTGTRSRRRLRRSWPARSRLVPWWPGGARSPRPWPPSAWARPSRIARWAAVVLALLGAGFWLGGYPGAVIFVLATGIFLAASGQRRAWRIAGHPWVLAGLVVAASACSAAGGHLLLTGDVGPPVTGLANAAPQVICLVVVARLTAALIAPPPETANPATTTGRSR